MEDSNSWWPMLTQVLMFGIPLILIGIGGILLIKTYLFMGKARQTTGTVVDVEESLVADGEGVSTTHYTPVFEYVAPDGQILRAKTFESQSSRPTVASQAEILVNPDTPDMVRMPGFKNYSSGALMLAIGCAALIGALYNTLVA